MLVASLGDYIEGELDVQVDPSHGTACEEVQADGKLSFSLLPY